ncbi:MAG: ligand-binding sensor domain-containing protein [Flavobacteriales bacterium]|jgi:ligand-binding sensor domain-containing protein
MENRINAFRKCSVFLLLGVILTFHSSAQRYQIDQYNLRDGLPQSQVSSLLQDHRGFLWVGTQGGGLAKFNGTSFEVINSGDGLPGNSITALIAGKEGNLFIGTDNGLCSYDGRGVLTDTTQAHQLRIEALYLSENELFVATNNGLFLQQADSISAPWEVLLPEETIFDVLVHNNVLYACSDKGVYMWSADRKQLDLLRFGSNTYCNKFIVTPSNEILVGTYGNGVLRIDKDQLIKDKLLGSASSIVFDGRYLTDGTVALGTQNDGVLLISPDGIIDQYDQRSGLGTSAVRCLIEDTWNNVWLGTSGSGLVRLSARPFTHYDRANGLPGDQVYSIAQLNNELIMGVSERGLTRFDGTSFSQDEVLSSGTVKALLTDSRGWLWAGTEGQGVFVFTPDTVVNLGAQSGLSGLWIRAFAEANDGSIYVATAGGGITHILSPFAPGMQPTTQIFTSGNALSEDRITDLAVDQQNRIWFSTRAHGFGVLMPGGDALNFDTNQGLPENEVRSVVVDNTNTLWIGMAGGQICKINLNDETYEIERVKSLVESPYALYSLCIDSRGHLWLGTANGAEQWLLDEERNLIGVKQYGSDEGFEGLEACSNACLSIDGGGVVFGTIDGMSMYDPKVNMDVTKDPQVFITDPHLFYRPFSALPQHIFLQSWNEPKDTLVLTYEQNNLSFDLTAIHLQYPDDITYQHFLVGSDADWSPLNVRTNISYSNLPPGNYSLHARACVKGTACAEARPIVIRILTPFWMETWFTVAVVAGSVLFLLLIFWLILRNVKRRARERNQRLRLERDVFEVEQKALRLQMNPHFIFNTLNSIQGLIASHDNKTARLYLSRFSRLMRQILENSREDLIPMEEELHALKHYLELEQFTHENCFDWVVDCPEELLEELVPPLILQPFVENSIVHGIIPKGKGTIRISVSEVENELVMSVEDDGAGREASEASKLPGSTHKSAGLDVTKERLAMLSGDSGGGGTITFIDLRAGDTALGTRVEIRLPLPSE